MSTIKRQSIFNRLPASYDEHPDLLKWVKADPYGPLGRISEIIKRGQVLDIGCGAGILGRLFSDNPDISLDGIDPAVNPDNIGLRFYRRFDQCMLEKIVDQNRIRDYDWFVFADVIEHMAFPDTNLSALVTAACPSARFLISTPNIAHSSIRISLLEGDFNYTNSGILESTHLRFFTRQTLENVINASGLRIDRLICLQREHYPEILDTLPFSRAMAAIYAMKNRTFEMTYQFLAVCSIGSGETKSVEVLGDVDLHWLRNEYIRRRYGGTFLGKLFFR